MEEHIHDEKLLGFYKRKLQESKFAFAAKVLNSQIYCGSRVITAPGAKPAAFLMKNDDDEVKYWGIQRCKSPWSCPVCSARQMSIVAGKIADLIDAMEHNGKVGIMITFSIPHLRKYTCNQIYYALEQTWKRFVHHGNGKGKNGEADPFGKFCNAMNCKHRIRVCEFTFGKNGWHPHFHCIFFIDRNKLKEAAQWQDKLTERWLYVAKQMTIKSLSQTTPLRIKFAACQNRLRSVGSQFAATSRERQPSYSREAAIAEVERLYANITEPNEGAFISKDENGVARKVCSSEYICGWGADKELTGNIRKKATHEGHYTPHQLLEMAFNAYQAGEYSECDEYFSSYVDYAVTVYQKYRMRLSPELNLILKKWRLTHKYTETLKKKAIERTEASRWRVLCWFDRSQWLQICMLNLRADILELARKANGRELIEQLLLRHQIDITRNGAHELQEFIENEIFNVA